MKNVRTTAYLPKSVSEEMKKHAKEYPSESAYIVEAVRQMNEKQSKKNKQ